MVRSVLIQPLSAVMEPKFGPGENACEPPVQSDHRRNNQTLISGLNHPLIKMRLQIKFEIHKSPDLKSLSPEPSTGPGQKEKETTMTERHWW